jgi:hypothetical protein
MDGFDSEGMPIRVAAQKVHGYNCRVSESNRTSSKNPLPPTPEAADPVVDEILAPQRSRVAERVERLRDATVKAAERRERLPQPLFWSLFRSEVEAIKKRKARARALSAALGIGVES